MKNPDKPTLWNAVISGSTQITVTHTKKGKEEEIARTHILSHTLVWWKNVPGQN